MAIHARQLEFIFEIRHRAQPAQQHPGSDLCDEMREQAGKPADFDVRMVRERFARQLHAQVERQRGSLAGTVRDADDQPGTKAVPSRD